MIPVSGISLLRKEGKYDQRGIGSEDRNMRLGIPKSKL